MVATIGIWMGTSMHVMEATPMSGLINLVKFLNLSEGKEESFSSSYITSNFEKRIFKKFHYTNELGQGVQGLEVPIWTSIGVLERHTVFPHIVAAATILF